MRIFLKLQFCIKTKTSIMMNFTSSTNNHRNPVLRAGLKGSSFASSFIVKPELVNLTNHNNNNIQSAGTNSFLTISKSRVDLSRVPDIQMINKYYGLVPKKFVINTRSDYSSKQSTKLQRARTAKSFNEENSTSAGFTDGIMLTQNKLKEFHDSQLYFKHRRGSIDEKNLQSILGDGQPDKEEVDLVAKKISVEKHKKWRRIKECGRSLSMMENYETNKESTSICTDKHHHQQQPPPSDVQRVIKIDLNNMRWEESYKTKSQTCESTSPDSPPNTPQFHHNGNSVEKDLTKTNENSNNNNNMLVPNQTSARRKGFMRKTISFDEQMMKNTSDNSTNVGQPDKEIEFVKPTKRPVTAIARPSNTANPSQSSSIQSQSAPAGRVATWTNKTVGQTDRRTKFQKSFSFYADSIDGGAESENEQEYFEAPNNNSPPSLWGSQKYRESKKSLHVQPPPEISTMISMMSPPPPEKENKENLQNEIDKVAVILNNMQDKISQVEDRKIVKDEKEQQDKVCSTNFPIMIDPEKQESDKNMCPIQSDTESFPVVALTPTILPDPDPVAISVKGRRPLIKAASISCENELFPSSCNDTDVNSVKKIRPQTSKGRGTVSFSSTTSTRLIPSRSNSQFNGSTSYPSSTVSRLDSAAAAGTASLATETLQSQASKNRKILIKKALIEINQSSINLGKKLNHGRPKTAPTLDVNNKKAGSTSINSHRRQPFKVSSPPIKIPTELRKNSTLNAKMDMKNSSKEASPEPEQEPSPPKVRVLPPRQKSFDSATDRFLVAGFPEPNNEGNDDISKDVAVSFLNSKKREQCLKIYEKMMKKGCNVKLETIFRGMMTPSEYRMFLEATELAEKSSNVSDTTENVNPGDAGVSTLSEGKTDEANK